MTQNECLQQAEDNAQWLQLNKDRELAGMRKKKKTKLGKSRQLKMWTPPIGEPMIRGRTRWLDMGNKPIRRMFISGGVSTFAEVMRFALETHCRQEFPSFSDVVVRAIPFWDQLADEDRYGWEERAAAERKRCHFIYQRTVPLSEVELYIPSPKNKAQQKILLQDEELTSDGGSDPDELPGIVVDSAEGSDEESTSESKEEEESELGMNLVGQAMTSAQNENLLITQTPTNRIYYRAKANKDKEWTGGKRKNSHSHT